MKRSLAEIKEEVSLSPLTESEDKIMLAAMRATSMNRGELLGHCFRLAIKQVVEQTVEKSNRERQAALDAFHHAFHAEHSLRNSGDITGGLSE